MEDMHRNHKETRFGWFSAVMSILARGESDKPKAARGVVTPWSVNAPRGWSA